MAPRYVDMTPSWKQTVKMCLVLLQNGNADGRATAEAELLRIGRLLDQKSRESKRTGFPADGSNAGAQ